MRLLIGEPLATDGLKRHFRALAVRHAALVIAKIELGQIAMQAALAAMLVDAFHATLEDREVAFNRICVGRAITVLTLAMTHDLVAHKALRQMLVVRGVVRDDHTLLRSSSAQSE